MKYSEFKDVVEKIWFSVSESTKIWIFVTNGSGLVVARVSRKEAFIFDTAYESFCLTSEPTHYDPYEIRSYTLSNARNMTIGVLTRDSVYKSIKQAITKNIGLEIMEVAE